MKNKIFADDFTSFQILRIMKMLKDIGYKSWIAEESILGFPVKVLYFKAV